MAYLLKALKPGGAEELMPECVRIFKTPLGKPGSWRLKLELKGGGDPLQMTVPSAEAETVFIMSPHGDTIEILGKRPQHKGGPRHRRDRQEQRRH